MIATTKQPGRKFGPAPRTYQPSTVEPLTPDQRRFNYLAQPGPVSPFSQALTPSQYRRLVKKARGALVRVWVPTTKRLQARELAQRGTYWA